MVSNVKICQTTHLHVLLDTSLQYKVYIEKKKGLPYFMWKINLAQVWIKLQI